MTMAIRTRQLPTPFRRDLFFLFCLPAPIRQGGLLALLLLLPLLAGGCQSMDRKTNYEGVKSREEVAILKHRGYRFWIYGDKREPVDELWLTPGEYMIGFVRSSSRTGGAARCILQEGRVYSFEITGSQYLPRSGLYAFLGRCFYDPKRKENLPPPPPGAKQRSWTDSLIFWKE